MFKGQREIKKMKYTYITHRFNEDGRGMSSASGGTLKHNKEVWDMFTEKYPNRTHLLIRKPDNKLMKFYHPMDQTGKLLEKIKKFLS